MQTLPQQSNRGLLQMETTLQDDIWEHLFLSEVRIGTKALSVTFLIK